MVHQIINDNLDCHQVGLFFYYNVCELFLGRICGCRAVAYTGSLGRRVAVHIMIAETLLEAGREPL